jgi:hypothetical protein
MATPAGYLYIRPQDHSGFKPTVVGFSKNVPEYPFPIWDPDRIIVQDMPRTAAVRIAPSNRQLNDRTPSMSAARNANCVSRL